MNSHLFRGILLIAITLSPIAAETFSFFTTLQAGDFLPTSREIGIGTTTAATDSSQSFTYDGTPFGFWRAGGAPQNFQLGWNATTKTGYISVFDQNGNATTASVIKPGAALNSNATWTIPTASFFASATPTVVASSIQINNLSFSPGVQVLSGALPSSLGASTPGTGPTQTTNLSAPIVINPASSGGSWYIAGSIQFSGLFTQGGYAFDNLLRVNFGVTGTDSPIATPEPATFALAGIGLIGVVLHQRRRIVGAVK